MVRIYCMIPNSGQYDDMSMTLSLEKALEWLKKHSTSGEVLEYQVESDKIAKTSARIWFYDNVGEPTLVCEDTAQ
jgi:hypothetical protein